MKRICVSIAVVVLAACGGSAADDTVTGPSSMEGELVVSAAASLTDVFDAMASEFEERHPGLDIVLNTGGSSALREQILEGAPVDVFASANLAVMDDVVEAGEAGGVPQVFALNHLQIAVPAGNPASVQGLEAFGDGSLVLGLCAPGVPCGDFAREALASAGVTPVVDTNEPDVRALLVKVAAGELDAAITYATDVVAEPAVDGVDIPADHDVVASYPITVLRSAPNPVVAAAFVEFVLSDTGRSILDGYGFRLP